MPDLLPERLTRAGVRLLRRVKTCRTERVLQDGTDFYSRRRVWWMDWLLPLSNWALRGTRPKVLMLPTGPWQRREVQMHGRLNRVAVLMRPRGMLVPAFAGQSLDGWLKSGRVSREDKLRALRLGMVALWTAHQQGVPTPHGVDRPFTHGDATCGNVVVALEEARAAWIDFETMHEEADCLSVRRADDLRALLLSALELLEPGSFPAVWRLVRDSYPDPEVMAALAAALRLRSRPMYHWAQALPHASSFHPQEHLSHGADGQPLKRPLDLIERKDAVHDRAGPGARE